MQQQAVLLSYIDVFALCAIIAAMLLPAPFVLLVLQPADSAACRIIVQHKCCRVDATSARAPPEPDSPSGN